MIYALDLRAIWLLPVFWADSPADRLSFVLEGKQNACWFYSNYCALSSSASSCYVCAGRAGHLAVFAQMPRGCKAMRATPGYWAPGSIFSSLACGSGKGFSGGVDWLLSVQISIGR